MSLIKQENNQRHLLDHQEFVYPDTLFIRDIDNKVFQGIVVQCLSTIEGVALLEGSLIDNIFSRGGAENVKGITSEQDSKSHSVSLRIEINVSFGVSIPQKAEEIQSKVSSLISSLTGLHVSSVHVIFRGLISSKKEEASNPKQITQILPSEELTTPLNN